MTEHSHDDHGNSHVMAPAMLIGVFVALLILTVVTVVLAGFPLGEYEVAVAMFIATIKAALVCFIFMHLMYDKMMNALFFFFSVVFAGLFVIIAMTDTAQYQDSVHDYRYKQEYPNPK